jgi:hypothetical protein
LFDTTVPPALVQAGSNSALQFFAYSWSPGSMPTFLPYFFIS